MLFMLIVKSSKNSEDGNLPSPELMEDMTRYNEEFVGGVRNQNFLFRVIVFSILFPPFFKTTNLYMVCCNHSRLQEL